MKLSKHCKLVRKVKNEMRDFQIEFASTASQESIQYREPKFKLGEIVLPPKVTNALRKNKLELSNREKSLLSKKRSDCICKTIDNNSGMVQCDQCDCWFHCDCMGLSAEQAKALEYFECPKC